MPKRKVVSELACYLALHARRPISGEVLRAALWPDADSEAGAKSLRNYMSELRRALGSRARADGPGDGLLGLGVGAVRLEPVHPAGEIDPADRERRGWLLKEALSLVRGRPFTGVTYNWAFSELLVSEMEVGVSEAARRLAALSMEAGDPATAGVCGAPRDSW